MGKVDIFLKTAKNLSHYDFMNNPTLHYWFIMWEIFSYAKSFDCLFQLTDPSLTLCHYCFKHCRNIEHSTQSMTTCSVSTESGRVTNPHSNFLEFSLALSLMYLTLCPHIFFNQFKINKEAKRGLQLIPIYSSPWFNY